MNCMHTNDSPSVKEKTVEFQRRINDFRQQREASEETRMEKGEWGIENRKWRREKWKWKTGNGEWEMDRKISLFLFSIFKCSIVFERVFALGE